MKGDIARCEGLPQFLLRRSDKALIEVHVDDFHGCGDDEAATDCVAKPRAAVDLKATDAFTEAATAPCAGTARGCATAR